MIELAEFKIQRSVFEVRYDRAFPLWDNSGSIGDALKKNFPQMRPTVAQPNQQQFSLGDRQNFVIEFEKSHLASFFPDEPVSLLASN